MKRTASRNSGTTTKPKRTYRKTGRYSQINGNTLNRSKGSGYANYFNPNELQSFDLVDAPIVGRLGTRESMLLRARIDKTIEEGMPIGKAFTIAKKQQATVMNYLRKHWGALDFRSYSLPNATVRIVRTA